MYSSVWQMFVVLASFIFSITSSYTTKTRVGSVSGLCAMINKKGNMDDFSVQIENKGGTGFYAILDGQEGPYSAKHAKQFLTENVLGVLRSKHSKNARCKYTKGPDGELDFGQMFTDFTDQIEAHLEAKAKKGKHNSSTACLMVAAEKHKLTVGNVGDSRGVMCDSNFKAIDLSVDHHVVDNPDEDKRIDEAYKAMGNNRKKGTVYALTVSRALGNFHLKEIAGKNVIISKPEIFFVDLKVHGPKFMILACHRLWAVLSSQEAVNFIKNRYLTDTDFGAKALAEISINSAGDNVAVMVVVFRNGTYQVGTN